MEKSILNLFMKNTSLFSLKIIRDLTLRRIFLLGTDLYYLTTFFFFHMNPVFHFPCKPLIIQSAIDGIVNPVCVCVRVRVPFENWAFN